VLKGYRVLRGPFFVAALMPTATSAFREECGPRGGDGAKWLPRATILGHAGGWPVLCSSEAHGVLRGPFFVSGADADGDVGVPVGMQAVWWGRAEWWPCATILGHAGGWPSRV